MKKPKKQLLITVATIGFLCTTQLNAQTLLADLQFDEPAGTDAASVSNPWGRSFKSAENVKTDGEGNLVLTPGDDYFYRLDLGQDLSGGVYALDYTLSDFNLENDLNKPGILSVGIRTEGNGNDKEFFRIQLIVLGKSARVRLLVQDQTIDLIDFKSKIMPADMVEFRAVLNLDEDRMNLYWRIHKDGKVGVGSEKGIELGKKGQSIRNISFAGIINKERMKAGNFVKIDKISLAKFTETEE